MLNPRSLVNALYAHWDVIELLVPLGREMPVFETEQILALLARIYPESGLSVREEKLRNILSAGLMSKMPRGVGLEIHPLVLDFVRGLTREHELGLSAVLRARVEGIAGAIDTLSDGLAQGNHDKIRQGTSQMSNLFRQIRQQLEQDHHAILELAERAKSADASLPITRRYGEVLSAYDEYIEPMAQMMDPGPEAAFVLHLERAERLLDQAYEQLTARGALYTLRQNVRHVAFQSKDVRRMGRELLNHSTEMLLPLREEVRQHNILSAAISELLGRVRKRGLKRALRGADIPLWRKDSPRRVTVGNEITAIMAEARDYQPEVVAFPEALEQTSQDKFDQVDEGRLHEDLMSGLPVPDLLVWLRSYDTNWRDETVLRLFHETVARLGADVILEDVEIRTDLNTVRVRYFPHGIPHDQKMRQPT